MPLSKATSKDAKELENVSKKEFAYKNLTTQKFRERMARPEISIFKKTVGGKFAGFVDIELSEGFGVINAISVKKEFRRRGIGKELLNYALDYMAQNGAQVARLLVKNNNNIAKRLYSKAGFSFAAMHDKKIDGKHVEVWDKKIENENFDYLN